jgi:hypothetical protein
MGYYSDNSAAYEGQESLFTLRQLIAGEGGNATHEAIFRYLMGHTFGPRYRDRRAGQMFLLVAPPPMRVIGAWDSYIWERDYGGRVGLTQEPTHPMEVVSMLNVVDGVTLSPYMLSIASRGISPMDGDILGTDTVYETPLWSTYLEVVEDRSLSINYITRELRYSSHTSIAIHNLILEGLYV